MNNNFKRKKKIATVPDFWGNTDDTNEPKTNKYVSNINNPNNLNKKNDRTIKKKIYSNDINKIITITKYNNFLTNNNSNISNLITSNKIKNSKINENNNHIDSKNDIKFEVKPIINTKITLNMNFYNIVNDNNENNSSTDELSNSVPKNDNVIKKFTELLYSYNKNINSDDVKDNSNISKQLFNNSGTNLVANEVNNDNKPNKKFIGKKRKIIQIKYSNKK